MVGVARRSVAEQEGARPHPAPPQDPLRGKDEHCRPFPEVQSLPVPIERLARGIVGDHEGDEPDVGDSSQFVGAARDRGIAEACPDPRAGDSHRVGAGRAGVHHGLAGTREVEFPGDDVRRVAPEDPSDGRHVRNVSGQVPAAECLLAQDGTDGCSHADSNPQRAQCFPVEPGVGDRFPGRVQREGAGPEEIRGFLEVDRLEHGVADRVIAGEAHGGCRMTFPAKERFHGIGQVPAGRADAAHARDGDRGDAHPFFSRPSM